MVRYVAIKRSKELKEGKSMHKADLNKLDLLLTKENIFLEEELKDNELQLDQIYLAMAKGAFIRFRARWLEGRERNTHCFFFFCS